MLKFLILFATILVVSQAFVLNRGHCGGRSYDPAFKLCCRGHVNSKYGIAPQCCGIHVYDSKFLLCCNGHVNKRFGITPRCCGNRVYDSAFKRCGHGSIIG